MLSLFSDIDTIAIFWFLACWLGYAAFSKQKAHSQMNLASSLAQVRAQWIEKYLEREVKIADISALGFLQRNVSFFASTTIFILAGLLTVLGSTEQIIELADGIPFVIENTRAMWEIKLLVLIFIFVYAFFKFSWCVRQYNFALIVIGASPDPGVKGEERENYVMQTNKLLTTANNSFALGIRAYSFALAVLAWFVNPWFFIFSSTWVVGILYRREFHSRSLSALQAITRK